MLLIVGSVGFERKSECVTSDAYANVSAELPPGCGTNCVPFPARQYLDMSLE